ncbi:MAG: hypothetical protein HEP71_03965 [Roseivirga sp.]|nr:hypothetical protein [Roseivirga sp.]
MKRLTITTLLLLICSIGYAQKWTRVYQNDREGKRVSGSIEQLMEAVREGLPVRIGWGSQRPGDPKRKVEHMADAKFLTIMSDETVFAQIDPIIGQTPKFDQQFIELKEGASWVLIAASNGKSDTMMTNTQTGEILGHRELALAIDWYVLKQ